MINFQTAEKALKSFYLSVIAEQLNTKINPLLSKIEQTSSDVAGKEIVKLCTYGVNGGVGAGSETGTLPTSGENSYEQFRLTLKNFFGKLEISDKALRASQTDGGAFVNLLNAEMDGLLKASKMNFGRMLYGDGSGKLATVVAKETSDTSTNDYIKVDDVSKFVLGMTIDIATTSGVIAAAGKNKRIIGIDRANKVIRISVCPTTAFAANSTVYVQNSKDAELTGLEAIFGNSETLYGLTRANFDFLKPYVKSSCGKLTVDAMQSAIDQAEIASGGEINFITASYDVRRNYVATVTAKATNVDVMNVDGGYKAISYSGIPMVADRYVPAGTMYMLNTDDFKLHQLCDWRWIEGEGGSVLHQLAGTPNYYATLVKYADLLCERPSGQVKISGITAE
ncbi:MAG: phage major capsid protein [Eubacteriales bacterium]|jgi:hypothetical protein|nr:phage major capsid protein [Faecalibacterium sp.]MDY3256568.1 phage major capsid protein [Eubacteriales bacterium]MDY6151588.1 phage major capsid protein [Eubacteriales bacterium]CCY04027.1 putative uncharacterized protein [Faecalibacterium sp. CAG:1138]